MQIFPLENKMKKKLVYTLFFLLCSQQQQLNQPIVHQWLMGQMQLALTTIVHTWQKLMRILVVINKLRENRSRCLYCHIAPTVFRQLCLLTHVFLIQFQVEFSHHLWHQLHLLQVHQRQLSYTVQVQQLLKVLQLQYMEQILHSMLNLFLNMPNI